MQAALRPFTEGTDHSPGLFCDGSPMMQSDSQGRTPLHVFCANTSPQVHRTSGLLNYLANAPGAKVAMAMRYFDGLTPLHTLLRNHRVPQSTLADAVFLLSDGPRVSVSLPVSFKTDQKNKQIQHATFSEEQNRVIAACVLQDNCSSTLKGRFSEAHPGWDGRNESFAFSRSRLLSTARHRSTAPVPAGATSCYELSFRPLRESKHVAPLHTLCERSDVSLGALQAIVGEGEPDEHSEPAAGSIRNGDGYFALHVHKVT